MNILFIKRNIQHQRKVDRVHISTFCGISARSPQLLSSVKAPYSISYIMGTEVLNMLLGKQSCIKKEGEGYETVADEVNNTYKPVIYNYARIIKNSSSSYNELHFVAYMHSKNTLFIEFLRFHSITRGALDLIDTITKKWHFKLSSLGPYGLVFNKIKDC